MPRFSFIRAIFIAVCPIPLLLLSISCSFDPGLYPIINPTSQPAILQPEPPIVIPTPLPPDPIPPPDPQPFGIPDDKKSNGIVGNVWRIPEWVPKIEGLIDLLDPKASVASLIMNNFDIAPRNFDQGIPGVDSLFEWFAIQFRATLHVPVSGQYTFRLLSDDGSLLYLDGNPSPLIRNDERHVPLSVSNSVDLNAGEHSLRLDYYQGPRLEIALQLFWQVPGSAAEELIPAVNFSRPK